MKRSTPVPLLVPSSSPKRPRESALPELPRESALPERPRESVLLECPEEPELPECPPASDPPKNIFLGGAYTRGPGSHSGHGWDFGQGHYGSSGPSQKIIPPWPPEAPDPPWTPEAPDPPWPPEAPASASRAPTIPPRCYCYGAGRAFREGEVMSRICLSSTIHNARPRLISP